jgi:RNA polymerase sigma factor (sigma-70 family)
MPSAPDDALLAGLAIGDAEAAVAFVRRFQRRVYGLALTVTGDRALAEDVAQDAFVRAWRSAAVYDPRRGSVLTWLLTITRNLAVDALRLHRADPVDPDVLTALTPPSPERLPDDRAVVRDEVEAVRRAMQDLPAEQRRALVLAAVYGRTAVEISRSEGIPVGTAKTRIRSGLLKLRSRLRATVGQE